MIQPIQFGACIQLPYGATRQQGEKIVQNYLNSHPNSPIFVADTDDGSILVAVEDHAVLMNAACQEGKKGFSILG